MGAFLIHSLIGGYIVISQTHSGITLFCRLLLVRICSSDRLISYPFELPDAHNDLLQPILLYAGTYFW